MSNIKFCMAARCEAAGRPNNEDNYQLDADLSDNEWGFTADKPIDLGKKGALLVVCDGMGGMNAGEVASDIAVSTIKEWFASDRLTADVLTSPMAYIKQAIIAADSAIKAYSKEHPETEGMGSTIVMAWMLGKKVYVGWCGDSRCYCYNPKTGLVRLSHDHSYVQELVDAGKLTEELAFDHPNNNIITRSLGDPRGTARPDVKEYDLHNEDILMLCSDGLCGCLRDNEIEEQIAAHQTSMQECRDALWVADEAAGWHDNVTIALAQVLSGGLTAHSIASASNQLEAVKKTNKRLKIGIVCLVLLLVGIAVVLAYKPVVHYLQTHPTPTDTLVTDSVGSEVMEVHSLCGTNEDTSEDVDENQSAEQSEQKTDKKAGKVKRFVDQLRREPIPEVQTVSNDTAAQSNATALPTKTEGDTTVQTGSAKTEQTESREKADKTLLTEGENQQETTKDVKDTVDKVTPSTAPVLSIATLNGTQGKQTESPSK